MENKVMKNIHILPTVKTSRLFIYDGKLGLAKGFQYDSDVIQNQKIYITSDEEIKDGDWVTNGKKDAIKCYIDWWVKEVKSDKYIYPYKKIILTTSQNLIADGVQPIDDEFLEWFVKNPSCERVEIVNNWDYNNKGFIDHSGYKIIIPKEEPKQETHEEEAEIWNEKQTTLEFGKPHNAPNRIKAFIEGAKWQQEQIGKSEFLQRLRGTLSDAEARRLIFEQFKNK